MERYYIYQSKFLETNGDDQLGYAFPPHLVSLPIKRNQLLIIQGAESVNCIGPHIQEHCKIAGWLNIFQTCLSSYSGKRSQWRAETIEKGW